MSPFSIAILLTGAIGHVILWCAIVNRIHAWGIPRRWIDALTIFSGFALVALPVAVFGALLYSKVAFMTLTATTHSSIAWGYIGFCNVVFVVSIVQRWLWGRHPERYGAVLANHTTPVGSLATDEP